MNSQPYRKMKSREMLSQETDTQYLSATSAAGSKSPHRKVRAGDGPAFGRAVSPHSGWYLPIKAAFDLVLGGILLIVTIPIMLVAAVLIKLSSRGPIFYCQVRLGKDGRPYTLYKLRTMVDKAEALTGPVWSTKDDARVTPLGKVLRKTHIDEFPQLWNVMCGQMSLIGPRPERPEFVAKLDWEIPCYRERLNVRPGITGLAQIRLPPDTDIESVRRKIVYDVYYVKNVSPWLDLRVLFVTGWSLVCELARHAWDQVSLPSSAAVEQGFLQAVSTSDFSEQSTNSMAVGVPE
jgi:lipopolysaccharide/colanic/teichoic acid biosynthesis glycosyltransferase